VNFNRLFRLPVFLCVLLLSSAVFGQVQAERPRLVKKSSSSQPVNAPAPAPNQNPNYRAPMVQRIVMTRPGSEAVTGPTAKPQSVMSQPASIPMSPALMAFNSRLFSGIQARLGIPYNYGSEGPRSYDCSGFVWSVFNEAGIGFDRSSARSYWENFEQVSGDDQYKFGTLVFFNHLGHVGIVADKEGFYQASSSKGITYSKFAGYWEKRIVGFRRVPLNYHR
jgi:cell wall-associated NlpC family hydrolase